ncbi:hypothetical protein G9A89_004509 [Geosiphon pyriformis]|nr:hypothetical protein G9A89_004509 [Geosiphon pyriformis]
MTNVHDNKKKDLIIAKAVPVHINGISIEIDMEQNQKNEQLDELNNEESDDKEDQEEQKETAKLIYTIFTSNSKPLDNVKANKKEILPISLIPRKEIKKVQKSFKNKPPEIQSFAVKQREFSSEENKIDIEYLLAKNNPVISKESDTLE